MTLDIPSFEDIYNSIKHYHSNSFLDTTENESYINQHTKQLQALQVLNIQLINSKLDTI